jgi:hypothetical protein
MELSSRRIGAYETRRFVTFATKSLLCASWIKLTTSQPISLRSVSIIYPHPCLFSQLSALCVPPDNCQTCSLFIKVYCSDKPPTLNNAPILGLLNKIWTVFAWLHPNWTIRVGGGGVSPRHAQRTTPSAHLLCRLRGSVTQGQVFEARTVGMDCRAAINETSHICTV